MSTTPAAVFVGSMNAMPMGYALCLRELGWNVTYFVDVPREDSLSRPESKFPSIGYPYPSWVIERPLRQVTAALSPGFLLRDVLAVLKRADVVFLSGIFLTLTRFLRPEQKSVFLTYGADLELWCDRNGVERLAELFAPRIGRLASRLVVCAIIRRMIRSLRKLSCVVTFPPGVSEIADGIIARELSGFAAQRVSRYDISFFDLPRGDIRVPGDDGELRVICGVRHTFGKHAGLVANENKGTDTIIRGLGKYARNGGKPFRVFFFEKGRDVQAAKALCKLEGIENAVVWQPELPFQDFLRLHQTCHVAFDQMGSHYFGGGMYAMYLGLPVIANGGGDALRRFWGESLPICRAQSADDVAQRLSELERPDVRERIGNESRRFALAHFDCGKTLAAILDRLGCLPAQPLVAAVEQRR
jgi:glycosyltransferase involved in cell wall biosynthesis